jgi:peroxiredoxin/Flp pilus assembly protein TadD
MRKNFRAAGWLTAAVLCAVSLTAAPRAAAAFRNVGEGAEAPAFHLKGIDGGEVSLDAYKKDKAVVIVFFATWSERSLLELADLEKIAKEYGAKGLKVIALNVEHEAASGDDMKLVKEKVAALGLSFPVLFDAGLETYRSYGVVAVPSTAVLGEGAVIRSTFNGYPSSALGELKEQVELQLGLRKPDVAVAAKADTAYKPVRQALLNYNLGRRLLLSGMPDKAEGKLVAAAAADPKWAAPRVLLGGIFLARGKKDKGKLEDAKREFEAAVAAEPENIVARTGLARVYWRLGSSADAEREADLALGRNAAYPPAMLLKAAILGSKGNLPAAEKWISDAIALNPNDPEAHALAGGAYEAAGDLAKAVSMYRKAWQLGGE